MPGSTAPPPVACLPADFATGTAIRERSLLPGVIPGVTTQAVFVPAGQSRNFSPLADHRRMVFIVAGAGVLQAGSSPTLPFGALALLLLPVAVPAVVTSTAALTLFEIIYAQTAGELSEARAAGDLPDVVHYADCPTYREAIKSPQTKNRTLVAPGRVPRFAMGSVETYGPDAVAPHAHPMLEQLFFGLTPNVCRVTANGAVADFGAPALLYIPRGSMHGAQVDAGHGLHYLWLDFFPTAADMQWITDQHIDDPPTPAAPRAGV